MRSKSSAKPALDPVRFSRLKLMVKSAAHYEAGFGEETGPMRKGSALHAYLLGGPEKAVVYEGGRRDDRIAAWRDFKAEHAGKHILIPSEKELVEGMRRSIERHQRAMDLLDDGVQENRIEWETIGRRCAGTPDVVKPLVGRKRLVELKTCNTSKPGLFEWQAKKLAYHAQVAWYADGLEKTTAYAPGPVDEVFIVAVESAPPYPVTVLRVCPSVLAAGARQWRMWFEMLLVCEQSNHFPAYAQGDVAWEWEDADGLDWGDGEAAA